jgi:hypothetical protein
MARPPKIPTPEYSLGDAIAAAMAIRVLRVEARDSNLDFFPRTVQDDSDVDEAVDYVSSHRARQPEVRAAEIPYRAVLITYQHQRDSLRYERRTLALLETAHEEHVPPRTYGPRMGLPSRAAVLNRRTRLTTKFRRAGRAPQTRRERDHASRLDQWLTAHRRDLLDVGEMLVDHREYLLTLLPADGIDQRQQLAEAIDQAGEQLSPRPGQAFAGAIAYAMFLLRDNGPATRAADPVIREGIELGTDLRNAFNELRAAVGSGAQSA